MEEALFLKLTNLKLLSSKFEMKIGRLRPFSWLATIQIYSPGSMSCVEYPIWCQIKEIKNEYIHQINILKEKYTTFSNGGELETNNKFWIYVSVDIHVPDYIVLWMLKIIHSTINILTARKILCTSRAKTLHLSHYYTTENHVLYSIFVNITILCTAQISSKCSVLKITTVRKIKLEYFIWDG